MRILFMGTPEFAVASLKRLVEDGHEVCGVFTQPDKPKNRGMKMTFSPVKEYALSQNLTVYQPLKMRDGEALGIVQQLQPELIVVAAYGRILPEEILNAPKYEIGIDETAQELTMRLAELGAQALSETVEMLAAGTAVRTPQDHSKHTYAPMLSKALSPIDWTRTARQIHDQVRGLIPWPCASTVVGGKNVKVHKTAFGAGTTAAPGTVVSAGKQGIEIACGDGKTLYITQLQAEGGKRMAAADYLRGHSVQVGV